MWSECGGGGGKVDIVERVTYLPISLLSLQLEYELDLTGQGENYHRGNDYHDNYHYDDHYSRPYNYHQSRGWSWGSIIGLIVMGTVLYWCIKTCCFAGG